MDDVIITFGLGHKTYYLFYHDYDILPDNKIYSIKVKRDMCQLVKYMCCWYMVE